MKRRNSWWIFQIVDKYWTICVHSAAHIIYMPKLSLLLDVQLSAVLSTCQNSDWLNLRRYSRWNPHAAQQAPANHTTQAGPSPPKPGSVTHPIDLFLHIPSFQLAVQQKWAWSPGKARPVSSIGRAWDSYEYAISRLRVRPPHRAVPILYHDWEVLDFFCPLF